MLPSSALCGAMLLMIYVIYARATAPLINDEARYADITLMSPLLLACG